MTTAIFRFYAELNDLLSLSRRFKDQRVEFKGRQTVKHLIESQGIPHTEVDLILADREVVGFEHIPQEGELVSVYPVFESFDISAINHLRPQPLRETKFVLDGHLDRLAAYLRMLGFDSLYKNDFSDEELAEISANDNRILLTRDRGLLKRQKVTHGFLIKTLEPREQLFSVVHRFHLDLHRKAFSRCIACNGILASVKKESILDQLEPKTRKYFNEFRRCDNCGKIYWRGSHLEKMKILIRWIEEKIS